MIRRPDTDPDAPVSRRHPPVTVTRLPVTVTRLPAPTPAAARVLDELAALRDTIEDAGADRALRALRALARAELPDDLAAQLGRRAPAFVAAYVAALDVAEECDDVPGVDDAAR